MPKDTIHLLVTFDQNYIPPFKTMLQSMIMNNPNEQFAVWLLHSAIPSEELNALKKYCEMYSVQLTPIKVDRTFFEDAALSARYPREMYYRLLAPQFIPNSVDRVLYLDADILVINSIRTLWEMDLKGNCFAAASHTGLTNVVGGINRVRLQTKHDYYNTGVILMDLKKARTMVEAEAIFQTVNKRQATLILPDQDVFNYLYGGDTLPIEEELWNYDTRDYSSYLIRSEGEHTMDWVVQNTVILHYCSKDKPWESSRFNAFNLLYKHYDRIRTRKEEEKLKEISPESFEGIQEDIEFS